MDKNSVFLDHFLKNSRSSYDQFKSNIPFTATLTKIYFDGTVSTDISKGVFRGVHVNKVNVQYGQSESLEDAEIGKPRDRNRITDEKDMAVCHDPNRVKTRSLFSYPADKDLHIHLSIHYS